MANEKLLQSKMELQKDLERSQMEAKELEFRMIREIQDERDQVQLIQDNNEYLRYKIEAEQTNTAKMRKQNFWVTALQMKTKKLVKERIDAEKRRLDSTRIEMQSQLETQIAELKSQSLAEIDKFKNDVR